MGFETRRQAQDEVIDWLAFYNCICSRNRPAFSSIRPPALQP
jgi:hypothetical protein